MTRRKLEALRALAERPGTEAEGEVAREMLRRAEAVLCEANPLGSFARFMRTGSMEDLASSVGPQQCDCGTKRPAFSGTSCPNTAEHERITTEIQSRFPRGARVYYNRWAYPLNCAGTVTGYSREWNWVRVKFGHLKASRAVPVYDAEGWHLSTYPIDRDAARWLSGGMENIEGERTA